MKFENYEGNFVEIEGREGYWVSDIGTVYSERSKKLLNPVDYDGNGHLYVSLYRVGRIRRKPIHDLVFEAFYEKPDFDYIVHHLDHNPRNNRVENLIAMTREDHAKLHHQSELKTPGKPKKKIRCLENGKEYESYSEAAKDLDLQPGNITAFFQGRVKAVKGYTFEKVKDLEYEI